MGDESTIDLNAFEFIEDQAAESLSKHKGGLSLIGLTSLSDTAAESLSKHKGDVEAFGGGNDDKYCIMRT